MKVTTEALMRHAHILVDKGEKPAAAALALAVQEIRRLGLATDIECNRAEVAHGEAQRASLELEKTRDHAARLLLALWPEANVHDRPVHIIDQIDNWIVGIRAERDRLHDALATIAKSAPLIAGDAFRLREIARVAIASLTPKQ